MRQICLVVALSFFTITTSCQNGASTSSSQAAISKTVQKTVSVNEFEKKLSTTNGAQLIDVRTPEEYADGHLNGAVNINVNDDSFDTQVAKLDKSKTVMVYCGSGKRSANASGKLHDLGFTEIYDLDGGITAWSAAGKAVAPSK